MRVFTKIYGFIVSVLTLVVLLFGLVFTVPKFFGYEPYVVVSSSMEPVIETGSVLFSNTNDTDVEIGDIVTYVINGPDEEIIRVSHRIVGEKDGYYITKGDNNDSEDMMPLKQEQIIGTYKMHIPKIGYLVAKLTSKVLVVTVIWIILLNTLSIVLNSLFLNNNEEDDKTQDDAHEGNGEDQGNSDTEDETKTEHQARTDTETSETT